VTAVTARGVLREIVAHYRAKLPLSVGMLRCWFVYFLSGVGQLTVLGTVGQFTVRIYDEVRAQPAHGQHVPLVIAS
jgi:hypothetical protein